MAHELNNQGERNLTWVRTDYVGTRAHTMECLCAPGDLTGAAKGTPMCSSQGKC